MGRSATLLIGTPPIRTARPEWPQPCTLAGRAPLAGHVLVELRAHVLGARLAVAALDVGHDPFPVVLVVPLHLPGVVGEADLHAARTVEQRVAGVGGQVLPGLARIEFVRLGQSRNHRASQVSTRLSPGQERPLQDRQRRSPHQQRPLHLLGGAQAAALHAGPMRRVEGEDPGFQLGEAGAAVGAGVVLAEEVGDVTAAAPFQDLHHPVCGAQRGLDRVREPHPVLLADHQPVHDDPDVVVLVPAEAGNLAQVVDPAIDQGAHESFPAGPVEDVPELALAAAHQRGQHLDAGTFLHLQQLLDDPRGGLALDGEVAARAVRGAHPRVQQPQIVVDLGHGAHGGARVARHGLLFDRDGWREPLDRVYVGLLHDPQELARVRGERFDVAALGPRRRSCRRPATTSPSRTAP